MILRDHDTNGDGTYDARHYVHHDANYNVTSLTDDAGDVVERFIYDPYGQPTVLDPNWAVDTSGSDFGWQHLHQGGRRDPITGLYHFRYRDYSAALGRWINPDPAGYIDGANLYQALRSSPVISLDPAGLAVGDWRQYPNHDPDYFVGRGTDSGISAAGFVSGLGWLPEPQLSAHRRQIKRQGIKLKLDELTEEVRQLRLGMDEAVQRALKIIHDHGDVSLHWIESMGMLFAAGGSKRPNLAPDGVGGGGAGRTPKSADKPKRSAALSRAEEIGLAREQAVADLVGGTVSREEIVVPGVGRTDIDVVGPAGELVQVGGPAKAYDLSRFGSQLKVLKEAAKARGVKAKMYLEEGTPQEAFDLAKRWLGDDNVASFPKP